MVLLLEYDSAIIEVKDEMPEGDGQRFSISLPPSSSVQELFSTVMDGRNYSPESYDLVLVKEWGESEVDRNCEKSLKEVGLSFGSANKNLLRIIPKTATNPSIVISLANKGGSNSSRRRLRAKSDCRDTKQLRITTCARKIGYVGLVNQAMTCYLNSLLQALFMTPEFRNSLYKWEFVGSLEETPKSIPYQLQKLFLNLQTSSRTAVETSKLTKSFGWDASDSWQQHDIQELCRVMFDALEQKFKDTDQADFINNLYQGKLIDYVTCLECKTEKTRVDTFLDIPLPVRPFGSTVAYNSVEEAMRAFIQPETLDGNNQYFCETCNKKCDAHKGLKFSHFPYILTLHLKRFDFDYNAMTRIKLIDRVEFPHVLNINGFLCDESKSSLSKEIPGVVSEGEISNNGTKTEDGSIIDNVSNGDDEGCQAAEPSHESASGSNSSGSNVDIQDYDEGIDLSNGTLNLLENEKNQRLKEGDGPPGPYIYELFSIMIHSGSASGGHYYVYIKDFDKGEWFCFDDQSVSRITNEDISMTYGGGSHRVYYSGAHSSSTNAYMLMYRQIDKKCNQSAMTIDKFPPHISELVRKMQEEEEEERIIRERDKDRLKIKVYFHLPGESNRFETKLVIDGDTTLAEATAIAHNLFILDGVVPLERCRLVSYDSTNETMDLSFDGQDGEPMSYVYSSIQNPLAQSLYLEIREPDAQFEPYRPGGIGIKVHLVNMETEEVEPPVEVRTQLTTLIGEMRPKIAKALKLSPKIKIMMEEYGESPIELDDEKTLQSAGFYTSNKIFVAEEIDQSADFLDKMTAVIERFSNTITLYCTLPDADKESLAKLGIPPLAVSDNSKLTNGDREAACESICNSHVLTKSTSRGTSPQLPPLEGEEECLANTVCSDQSTSEDSSLTDSDRTIVGDEADYWTEVSPVSNSPSEEKDPSSMKIKREGNVGASEKEGDNATDDEFCNNGYYYLKIYPYKMQDSKTMVRIQVDKRMVMGALKAALARHMGIASDYIKLFRKCKSNEFPYSNVNDPLSKLCDVEHIIVRLERALRHGEYRGKVFQLFANDEEPMKFLCDWILTKDMLVGEAKKNILEELAWRNELYIPSDDRCRLRMKKWKNPGKILLDSQSFQDLCLTPNWELCLQELNEPENVTSPSQVTLMVKQFKSNSDIFEITLENPSFAELREKLSEISGIPLESLEFARPLGSFPYNQHRHIKCYRQERNVSLQWETICSCNLEDGTFLYYRNKDADGVLECNGELTGLRDTLRRNYRCLSRRARASDADSSLDQNDQESGADSESLNTEYRQIRFMKPHRKDGNKDGKALRIVVSPTPTCIKENVG